MIKIALLIATISVSAAVYTVHNTAWAAREPCNGEIETIEKIEDLFWNKNKQEKNV